jgi:hypothetical protein
MYLSGWRIFSEIIISHVYLIFIWHEVVRARHYSSHLYSDKFLLILNATILFLTRYLSRRIDRIERIIRYLIMIITIINSEEKKYLYRIYCLNNFAYMNRISFSSTREEVWSLMIVYHISNLIIWWFLSLKEDTISKYDMSLIFQWKSFIAVLYNRISIIKKKNWIDTCK